MKWFLLLLPMLLAACVTESPQGERVTEVNKAEAARTNTTLAAEYSRNGNYEMALEKALKALSQDDGYAPAHSTIALIYTQRGDEAEAIKHYRRAISLDPRDLYTRNNFAIFECERGRTDAALELFESVAGNKSYSARDAALINAGVCANRANRNDKAETYFREALELRPDMEAFIAATYAVSSCMQAWPLPCWQHACCPAMFCLPAPRRSHLTLYCCTIVLPAPCRCTSTSTSPCWR